MVMTLDPDKMTGNSVLDRSFPSRDIWRFVREDEVIPFIPNTPSPNDEGPD
jgi:hypothetical protein